MELAVEALHGAMQHWAANGLPTSEVGFKLADEAGRVLAEAELVWVKLRVAVLHGEQAENAAPFEQAGRLVCSVGDDGEGAGHIINNVLDQP